MCIFILGVRKIDKDNKSIESIFYTFDANDMEMKLAFLFFVFIIS